MNNLDDRRNQLMISGIMLGVLVWGAFLAIGAFLLNFDVRKGLIVYGSTVAFLLFWGVMLALRQRREKKSQDKL